MAFFLIMLTQNSLSSILCKTYTADLVSLKYCTNVVLLVWVHLLLTYTAISEIWIEPSLCKAKGKRYFLDILIPMEIHDNFFSERDLKCGLMRSSTVTAARALMLEDTVLQKARFIQFFYLRSWNHNRWVTRREKLPLSRTVSEN